MERSVGAKALTALGKILPGLLYLAAFLGLWQLVVVAFGIKEFVLPSPFKVL